MGSYTALQRRTRSRVIFNFREAFAKTLEHTLLSHMTLTQFILLLLLKLTRVQRIMHTAHKLLLLL